MSANSNRFVAASTALLLLVLGGGLGFAQTAWPGFDAVRAFPPLDTKADTLLDFNGDGWMDAAGGWNANIYGAHLDLHRNDGTGNLVHHQRLVLASGQLLNELRLPEAWRARWNHDGYDDVLVYAQETLYAFVWQPSTSTMIPAWTLPVAGGLVSLVVQDLDGDGLSDLAVIARAVGLAVLKGVEGAIPVATSLDPGLLNLEGTIVAAELTGDAQLDLAIHRSIPSPIILRIPMLPGLQLGASSQEPVTSVVDDMLASGDIDNDGDEDLVLFREQPISSDPNVGHYLVGRRTGPSTIQWEAALSGGPADRLLDIDGDGDLDGLCCSGGSSAPSGPNFRASTFRVTLNTGGLFGAPRMIPGIGALHLAGAADLDHDGDLDLVSGRGIYKTVGPWTDHPTPVIGDAFQFVQDARDLADADGDGDLDLRYGLAQGGPRVPFRNTGNGDLLPSPFQIPAPPLGFAWETPGYRIDADNDGDQDLMVAVIGSGVPPRLLRNTGAGGLVDAGTCLSPSSAMGQVFGQNGSFTVVNRALDVDGDSDEDLFVIHPLTFAGEVWRNDGGEFTLAQTLAGIRLLDFADLDGDGRPELLTYVGNSVFTTFQARRNLGALFEAAPSIDLGHSNHYFSHRPVVMDADGDGDLDLVAPRSTPGSTSLYARINDGSGNFQTDISTYLGPTSVFVFDRHLAIDLNQDGRMDLVTGSDVLSWPILCSGPGFTFTLMPQQAIDPRAVADMDGDGDPDLVSRHVIKNMHFHGPSAGRRDEYGTGVAGSGGFMPVVGDEGPLRTGLAGTLRIRGGVGGASGVLILGAEPVNLPIFGVTLLVSPDFVLPIQLSGPPGAPGEGSFDLPWLLPPGLAGVTIRKQVGIADPNGPEGLSASAAMKATFGN